MQNANTNCKCKCRRKCKRRRKSKRKRTSAVLVRICQVAREHGARDGANERTNAAEEILRICSGRVHGRHTGQAGRTGRGEAAHSLVVVDARSKHHIFRVAARLGVREPHGKVLGAHLLEV